MFEAPPALSVPSSANTIASGVDVRADAGYIVFWAPGYTPTTIQPASLPDALCGLILEATPAKRRMTAEQKAHRYMSTVLDDQRRRILTAAPGQRHNIALRAGVIAGAGARHVGWPLVTVRTATQDLAEIARDLAAEHERT